MIKRHLIKESLYLCSLCVLSLWFFQAYQRQERDDCTKPVFNPQSGYFIQDTQSLIKNHFNVQNSYRLFLYRERDPETVSTE